jgi:uncharacterized protein (DUF2141 family)
MGPGLWTCALQAAPGRFTMKTKIAFFALAAMLAVSCVLPNHATMLLRNQTGKTIVSVFYRETGTAGWGIDWLNATGSGNSLANGENHSFMGIDPGSYEIRVVFSAAEGGGEKIITHDFGENVYSIVTVN